MKRSYFAVWPLALFLAATWGPSAAGAETVKDNYRRFCVQCHGALGTGYGINQTYGGLAVEARNHTSTKHMSKLSDKELRLAITKGGFAVDKSSLMPAFGTSLSAQEIDELVVHLRKMCGCKGPE